MNMNDFIEVLQQKNVPYSIDGDKIFVDGHLNLHDTSITSLPDNLSVGGDLNLSHTDITHLPDNLSVGGKLDLRGTNITSLPDNLKVNDYLDLRCTGITSLPDNFSVGDGIDLRDTKIISLPNNLSVGHILCLQPENISNVAYRENCGKHNLTIFAARVNGGIRISADFSMRTLSDFEIVVDLKYLSKNAEDYKQAARECVAELEQRWKGTGGSATWLNVSECLPELDTPVLGCWFSDNGNFVLGCYVRTYSADAGGWVWTVAEDFGDGHWLFDDDYPIEFWMPLPGKPELAGGAA